MNRSKEPKHIWKHTFTGVTQTWIPLQDIGEYERVEIVQKFGENGTFIDAYGSVEIVKEDE